MIAARQASRASLSKDGRTVTVHIPFTFRQQAGRKQILGPSGSAPWSPAPRIDTTCASCIWRGVLHSASNTRKAATQTHFACEVATFRRLRLAHPLRSARHHARAGASDPEIVEYLKAADTAMNAALNDASVFLEKQEG